MWSLVRTWACAAQGGRQSEGSIFIVRVHRYGTVVWQRHPPGTERADSRAWAALASALSQRAAVRVFSPSISVYTHPPVQRNFGNVRSTQGGVTAHAHCYCLLRLLWCLHVVRRPLFNDDFFGPCFCFPDCRQGHHENALATVWPGWLFSRILATCEESVLMRVFRTAQLGGPPSFMHVSRT